MEIEFKKIALEDRDLVTKYLWASQVRSCEETFANTYLWSRQYPIEFAIVDEMLVFKTIEENPSFDFPRGQGDLKVCMDKMMDYYEEKGYPFRMHLVTEEDFAKLEALYPGKLKIEYDRDVADYVYETEKLITLAGKKYHGKRNHINKFRELYPDWVYEKITDENLDDAFQMALKWRHENACDQDEEKRLELCVTMNALRLLKELHLSGGLIRAKGQVVAIAIGEPVSEDTFVVHNEKAFADVPGAYPMINQQFAAHEAKDYKYTNREEDTGSEGLRKAKLSYRPEILLQKGIVTYA